MHDGGKGEGICGYSTVYIPVLFSIMGNELCQYSTLLSFFNLLCSTVKQSRFCIMQDFKFPWSVSLLTICLYLD